MNERRLSATDRLLSGLNHAMTTVRAPAARHTRDNPAGATPDAALSSSQKTHAAGLMRVNHAGEVAAQGLYQGHAVVSRSPVIAAQMQQAAAEEIDHLGWCEQRLHELDSRPSKLCPIWYTGAFLIGAASGALGDRWALGFVEETEQQVADHLTGHLQKLPAKDVRSRKIVEKMRAEEEQHGADAKAAGAAQLPQPVRQLMRACARVMTRSAYWM